MIVVSNTTPIHYLILIGEIGVLKDLFGQVVIPQAAFDEMQHEKTPEEVKAWLAAPPAWLEIKQAGPSLFRSRKKIGDGEKEAIALALELNADALLMDDRDGMKEAHRNNVFTISTLAILKMAADQKLLNLSAAIALLSSTNFRMPSAQALEKMFGPDIDKV